MIDALCMYRFEIAPAGDVTAQLKVGSSLSAAKSASLPNHSKTSAQIFLTR